MQRNSGYDMKWSELRRIAERKGWFLLKNGKKHDIYKHPDSLDRIEIRKAREGRNSVWHLLQIEKTDWFLIEVY